MRDLPELDTAALASADLAFLETEGTGAQKVRAAIRAYLWADAILAETGFGPSLNDWREAVGHDGG